MDYAYNYVTFSTLIPTYRRLAVQKSLHFELTLPFLIQANKIPLKTLPLFCILNYTSYKSVTPMFLFKTGFSIPWAECPSAVLKILRRILSDFKNLQCTPLEFREVFWFSREGLRGTPFMILQFTLAKYTYIFEVSGKGCKALSLRALPPLLEKPWIGYFP